MRLLLLVVWWLVWGGPGPSARLRPPEASASDESLVEALLRLAQPVARLAWPAKGGDEFLRSLTLQRRVAVVTGAPFFSESRLLNWTPDYLGEHVGLFEGVLASDEPDFLYTDKSVRREELSAMGFEHPESYFRGATKLNMTAKDFFSAALDRPFLYFTRDAEKSAALWNALLEPDLPAAVAARFRLAGVGHGTLQNGGAVRPMRDVDPEFFLWVGTAGVTAVAHYDAVYNHYLQLHGRKRFLLFPTEAVDFLRPYPRVHPSARQSSLSFRAPAPSAQWLTALAAAAPPLVAELQPGDLLVLPPYVFHHVTATSASVSLSVWTRTEEDDLEEQAEQVPLPFEADWSWETMRARAACYIASVAAALRPGAPAELLGLRYARFKPLNVAARNAIDCAQPSAAATTWHDVVQRVSSILKHMRGSDTVRKLYLFDYLELVARTAARAIPGRSLADVPQIIADAASVKP
jgi:hypothetical protein